MSGLREPVTILPAFIFVFVNMRNRVYLPSVLVLFFSFFSYILFTDFQKHYFSTQIRLHYSSQVTPKLADSFSDFLFYILSKLFQHLLGCLRSVRRSSVSIFSSSTLGLNNDSRFELKVQTQLLLLHFHSTPSVANNLLN